MQALPRNILEQQTANRRNTILVMAIFVAFLGCLGMGFDYFMLGFAEGRLAVPFGTINNLVIGSAAAIWSLEKGATTVLLSSCARPVAENDPRYQQLRNILEEMSIASGLPRAQLYSIPDPDPNAFATGKDPEHACIVVTEGLLDRLSREELQAVIAHEMSHVRNYDTRVMTVVAALIGTVMLLSEFGLRTMRFGGSRRRNGVGRLGGPVGAIVFALWLLAMILAPLISQLLALAVSRQREYLADASGAELTRNPGALASALEKIDAAVEPTRLIKKGTGHLCIADPLGRAVNSKEGFVAELFSTHPPINKRIVLLRAMAYQ
jgi:heat shock protein HtpX